MNSSSGARLAGAVISAVAIVVIALVVSVFHGSSPAAGAMCFKQPSTAQLAELQQYVSQHPGSTVATKNTKDVCVLVPNGHGSYLAQYYGPSNGYQWYPLYVAMSNSASNTARYGQVKGTLTTADRITLDNLTEVGPDGKVTQPYTLEGDDYVRTNTLVDTVKVNAVRYGLDDEESPTKAFTNPSSGYVAEDVPVSTNNAGTADGGSFHVSPLKAGSRGYNAPVDDDPVHITDDDPVHVSGDDG